MSAVDLVRIDRVIDRYEGEDGFLIQLLLDIQKELGWIPKEAIWRASERLGVPRSHIYRIASFYKAMNLSPAGRHTVQVCMGTACQVRGASKILALAQSRLNVKPGETTPDMAFSLRRVNCLGCCAMGPVVMIDDCYHGCATPESVDEMLGEREII